ncbi:MAG TPA: Mu transposase C-terminal domain-containing protein [Pyrinomonadaceae bacterium]|nr:Mu transposase C-terminal domain-containing protein [Pyrinomonadaceae bacterium]
MRSENTYVPVTLTGATFLNISPDAIVESNGKRYTITHVLDLEAVLCKEEGTGKQDRLYIKDLTPVTAKPDEDTADSDLATISDEEWSEARRRYGIIQPLLYGRRTTEGVAEQARAAGVHLSTIYRWIDIYKRRERLSDLLPAKRSGGRGESRLPPETEVILKETIEDYYLNAQKRSAQKTFDEVRRRCRNAGVAFPHPNTVRFRISQLSEEVKMKRRLNAKAAREKFAPVKGHFPGADYPLAVVQIDHTPLDIILVDDVHRLPVGRPWITLAIDVFSRMVAGLYVSFDPPGALSTGLCIAHAILPKEKWLARYGITAPWPCWGVMKTIHADNAKEFHSNMLQRGCEEHGIELKFRPVATPHYGGHIERLLGTVLKEIHSLPGTTFSNPRERGEYDSEAKAAMTLFEFEKWLANFIVGVYHQRLHNSLQMSPIKKYEQGVFGTEGNPGTGLPARIVDEDRLRLDFMPYDKRTIQSYGVVIEEIHYYSDVLRRFINAADPDDPRRKKQFTFRRDPRDISQVYFYDDELKQYSRIPYRDTSHPPISIWELREVRRQLEKEGRESVDESVIFEAYERMRAQEAASVRETKRARRASQRRSGHQQITPPKTPDDIAPVEAPSDGAVPEVSPFDEMEELD